MAGKDFFELVKAIGESKSKQEEDRIVAEEIVFLKKKIAEQGNKKKMKEFVVRAMYIEMLGQDASFAYIRAVELCASTNIFQKRVGFLASSLFLSPEHEFRFMLVNQIQRDMSSSNQLEVCTALSAVCKIVTVDMIPAVLGEIMKLIKHDMEPVRKHAVCALHRLYQMDKDCLQDHVDKIRQILCDRDPSVMGASLSLLHDMIQDDPAAFKDLVPSFVSILKQLVDHRLPREFDYHRIPAPWIQMDILKILAILGRGDQSSSEGMYEVLVDVMRRADTGINVGYAIVYESVRTVTTIYPNPLLLDTAATAISRFIRSESHNLKYIGIKGLAAIVNDHPRYAADHQMAVIDCLEDPDETLKRKTLDLLYRMTNSVNVEFIVDKLLTSLASATDDHFRSDLVNRITQCAERFAPSNAWFVATMVRVFELAGDKVKMSVAQTLMQLIAEGSEDDGDEDGTEEKDAALRREAVENFLGLINKPKLPDVLAQTMAWVLGEYGYLSTTCSKEAIIEDLCHLANQKIEPSTRAYLITAIMKIVTQNGSCPPCVTKLIEHYSNSASLDVYQRCIEFRAMLKASAAMADALPVDASCEDIEVDERLPMLQHFVQKALNNGANPYTPRTHVDDDEDDDENRNTNTLKYQPYARAAPPVTPATIAIAATAPTVGSANAGIAGLSLDQMNIPTHTALQPSLMLGKNVSQVWGKKPEPPPPAPVPSPAAAPTVTSPHQSAPTPPPQAASSVSQSKSQSPIIEPTAPRVPTEKEKMAAALFGGIGSSKPASGTAVRRTSQTTHSPAYSAPSPPAMLSGSGEKAQVSTSHASASGSAAANLLDMMSLESDPVPANTFHGSNSGLDLLADLNDHSTPVQITTQSPAAQSKAPAASVFDAFDDVLSPVPVAAPAAMQSSVGGMLNQNGMSGASSSVLRPLSLKTSEFGTRWSHTPCEAKQSTPCRLRTLAQVRAAVEFKNGNPFLGHVESIQNTNESIFAGSLTSGGAAPLGSLVLVHIKLNAARMECNVTVKSASKELCQELARHFCDAISHHSP